MEPDKDGNQLKIVTLYGGGIGFRERESNPLRLDHALLVLRQATRWNADAVIFPAGYFTVTRESETTGLLEPIFRMARKAGIAVAVGVDQAKANRLTVAGLGRVVRNYDLPCFLYTYEPDEDRYQVWRQRSGTSENAYAQLASDWLVKESRSIMVKGCRIEFIFCGEIYDDRIIAGIVNRKPSVAVCTGHMAMSRFGRTLKRLLPTGLNLLLSEHRNAWNGLHFAVSRKKDISIRGGLLVWDDYLWSELRLWEIPPGRERMRPSEMPVEEIGCDTSPGQSAGASCLTGVSNEPKA
ncbi:MAG: hypothetical protein JXR97_12125 [Planctomycetes bacterium]|nr:hypothetical protein [Planctomycetota bacterium]